MRTAANRAFTTLVASAAVVLMAATGASAATTSGTAGAAPAPLAPSGATAWEYIGEFPRSQCYALRDSYAGRAKCERNAGGLFDLYVWV
ncbi:hypothetical protein ABT391_02805 [Streptomyces jumonjinensis]|uniref:hypothetical protein n=1 Tax=Streptomyces jumonjinensis TaxID=1945 RepID=UPI0033318A74